MLSAACALGPAEAPSSRSGSTAPPTPTQSSQPKMTKLDPQQAQRLQRVMLPLIQAMNKPVPTNQVQVGVMDDPHINAANAGGAKFLVTTGLLQKANDDQLRAVLAHEIAHQDLGHVAKTEALGTGLQIGAVLLDQLFPNVGGVVAPIAGQLALNAYTRNEEYAADRHGVEILRKAGYDGKTLMAQTLTWLQETEGGSGGGFFATHPATGDRVQAVQRMP
jgi:putative metalloprotease